MNILPFSQYQHLHHEQRQLIRQVFFYVPEGEGTVNRKRPDRHFKELKGVRKLHSVKATKEQEKVFVRDRTCYCLDCITGEEGKCTNKKWINQSINQSFIYTRDI